MLRLFLFSLLLLALPASAEVHPLVAAKSSVQVELGDFAEGRLRKFSGDAEFEGSTLVSFDGDADLRSISIQGGTPETQALLTPLLQSIPQETLHFTSTSIREGKSPQSYLVKGIATVGEERESVEVPVKVRSATNGTEVTLSLSYPLTAGTMPFLGNASVEVQAVLYFAR